MNRIYALILIVLFGNNCIGQNISLAELTTLCNKPSWESVDDYLVNKGWEYYSSEKGQSNEYSTITWAYQKEIWSDKAIGWIHLYSYDGHTDKISMQFHNVNTYKSIKNSLNSSYKLVASDILDETITTDYANDKFVVSLTVNQSEDDEYVDNSKSIYLVTIIRKNGIYDDENGFKQLFEDGDLAAEVNLKNGKLNGLCKFYYTYDGSLKMKGVYLDGEKNGRFQEYDFDGSLSEYTYSMGRLNGPYIIYYLNGNKKIEGTFINGERNGRVTSYNEDGSKEAEVTYINDKGNGPFILYYPNGKIKMTGKLVDDQLDGLIHEYNESGKVLVEYNAESDILDGKYVSYAYDNNGEISFKSEGNYQSGRLDGRWEYYNYKNKKPELIGYKTFYDDKLNGPYFYFSGDSIIVTNFEDDLINGNYRIYFDLNTWMFGGIPKDTAECILILNCNYLDGLKEGYYKEYSISGQLLEEGTYHDDMKEGTWLYYFDTYTNIDTGQNMVVPWSGMLFLQESYHQGLLNGVVRRFAYIEDKEEPCPMNIDDTCYIRKFVKEYESLNYVNDILQGEYILMDSADVLMAKGWYSKGKRDSFWFIRLVEEYDTILINSVYDYGRLNGKVEIFNRDSILIKSGYFENDLRTGIWREYYKNQTIKTEYRYKSGKLDGQFLEYYSNGKVNYKCYYTGNQLQSIINYDSLGTVLIDATVLTYDNEFLWFTLKDVGGVYDSVITYKMQNFIFNDTSTVWPLQFVIAYYVALGEMCKDGEYSIYNRDTVLIECGSYKCDYLDGEQIRYFKDQDVKCVVDYDNGLIISEAFYVEKSNDNYSGILIVTDIAGNITEEIKIKNGRRNGKTKYFNQSGNIEKIVKYEDGIRK